MTEDQKLDRLIEDTIDSIIDRFEPTKITATDMLSILIGTTIGVLIIGFIDNRKTRKKVKKLENDVEDLKELIEED